MFDDPKKNLRRMEEALWEAEYEDTPEEENPDWTEGEEDWLEQAKELLDEDPPIRNHANGYGARNYAVDFDRTVYDDEEEMDDKKAVYDDAPPPKGIGGLVFLAVLELLGIVAIALWWLKWLL